jgi:hypothetical protein
MRNVYEITVESSENNKTTWEALRMDVIKIGCEGTGWFQLAQEWSQRLPLMKTAWAFEVHTFLGR